MIQAKKLNQKAVIDFSRANNDKQSASLNTFLPLTNKLQNIKKNDALKQSKQHHSDAIFTFKNISKYSAIMGGFMALSQRNIFTGSILGITGLLTYNILSEIEKHKIKPSIKKSTPLSL